MDSALILTCGIIFIILSTTALLYGRFIHAHLLWAVLFIAVALFVAGVFFLVPDKLLVVLIGLGTGLAGSFALKLTVRKN